MYNLRFKEKEEIMSNIMYASKDMQYREHSRCVWILEVSEDLL